MFNLQKQRMVRSELFTHWRYTCLTVEARLTLIGLLGWASDDGDVDLNTEFLTEKMFIRKGQSEEDLSSWIEELVRGEHLRPYIVEGKRYALITGWNDPYSAVKQSIAKTKWTYTWRNPTPEDSSDEPTKPVLLQRVKKKPQKALRASKPRRPSKDIGEAPKMRVRRNESRLRKRSNDPDDAYDWRTALERFNDYK